MGTVPTSPAPQADLPVRFTLSSSGLLVPRAYEPIDVRRRPPTLLIAIVYALLITIVSWATMLSVFAAAAWLAGAATVLTSLSQSGWLPPLQGPWARPATPALSPVAPGPYTPRPAQRRR
jgi:hypothetical protein